MDQDAFHQTYQEFNELFCAYEKGILSRQCECALAEKLNIAEREAVRCQSEEAREHCFDLLELLRKQSRFVLKSLEQAGTIPHNKAMKVQVGGLRGLHAALEPNQPVPVIIVDIHGTIEAAVEKFGSLEELPFQVIVQQIAAFEGRKRSRKRRR